MTERIRLLMTQDNADNMNEAKSALESHGMDVSFCMKDGEEVTSLENVQGNIEFRDLTFRYPGGEYDEESGIKFVRLLDKAGYFDKANTVSFEMRPIDGYTAEDSLKSWVDIWKKANEERM